MAVALELISNLKGPTGPRGPQGLPGLNSVPTDEAIAALVNQPGTGTNLAIEQLIAEKAPKPTPRVVNVVDYGADLTGATDSTTAVRAAVAALKTRGGGTLLYPAGIYRQQDVELNSDTIVSGYGATIRTNPNSYNVFITKSNGARGYGSGASRITLQGIRFLGSFADGRECSSTFHHTDDLFILDCIFEQCYTTGHVLDIMGCRRVVIQRSQFVGWKPLAGREYAEAIQLDHSWRQGGNYDAAGSYDGLPTKDVYIDRCVFRGLTTGGVTYQSPAGIGNHASLPTRPSNINVTNNLFTDVGDMGSADGSNGGGSGVIKLMSGVVGMLVSGNVIKGTGSSVARAVCVNTGTIGIADGANFDDANISATTIAARPNEQVTIVDNSISGFGGSASEQVLIYVNSTAANPSKTVTVAGNQIADSANAWGIRVLNVIGLVVANNVIANIARGVSIVGGRNVSVISNAVTYSSHIAYDATDTCVSIAFTANTARACAGGMRLSSDVQEFVISGNAMTSITSSTILQAPITVFAAMKGMITGNVTSGSSKTISDAVPGIRIVEGTHPASGVSAQKIVVTGNAASGAVAVQVDSGTTLVTQNNNIAWAH